MNQKRTFLVRSSDGVSNYSVDFVVSELGMAVLCSCPAGVKGKLCKHKLSLLKNQTNLLVENLQAQDLGVLLQSMRNGNLLIELHQFEHAEAVYEVALASLNQAKKRLENSLKGSSVREKST